MLITHPDILRADMQHFYGLDLDELGYSIRIRRAADLAANLPPQALIWGQIDPRAQWTTTDYLLANIADNTGFLAWSKTKAAKGRYKGQIPRPGQHPAPAASTGIHTTTGSARSVEELKKLLNLPDNLFTPEKQL